MIAKIWKANLPVVSWLSILESTRTSVTEPRLYIMRSKENTWSVRLYPKDSHLRNEPGPYRRVSDPEAVDVPRKILRVHP